MREANRVVWMTNLAAPYRLPVWRHLARKAHLRVEILETNRRLSKDVGSNRGDDWAVAGGDLRIREVRTARVSRLQDRYYITCELRNLGLVASADAVVLGGWDALSYWQALAVAKLRRTATVGFYESILATQKNSTGVLANARSLFFRSLDAVVVPGPAARDAVLAMGVRPERIFTGFNAVDTEAFAAARFASDRKGGHRFLYVGQLIRRKRVGSLLKGFANIRQHGDSLRIVGRGELDAELKDRARDLGVSDDVTWDSFIPNAEMPRVMAEADTLVLPSGEEVWGLVVNEALAAGLQVVVTEQCGVVPSVRAMGGVYVAPSSGDLEAALAQARAEYRGRIKNPAILEKTPEAFAEVFWEAIQTAVASRNRS